VISKTTFFGPFNNTFLFHYYITSLSWLALVPFTMSLVVFGSDHIFNTPQIFVLSERIIRRDHFDIQDDNGNKRYAIKGKFFSIHQRKFIQTPDGKNLAQIEHQHFTMHRHIELQDLEDKTLVIARTAAVLQLHSNVELWLTQIDPSYKRKPDLVVEGSIMSRTFEIFDSSKKLLASSKRKVFTMKNMLTGQDTYYLEVQPGVDCLLMVGVVVILDEMFNDKKS